MPRLLVLLLVLGCASRPGSDPTPVAAVAGDSVAVEWDGVCERRAAVAVHVDNQSSMDVEISFGSYTPGRAAPGLSRTTYKVARTYLQSDIRLRIARGGLGVGTPPPVRTEFVVCNDATLIIGPRPEYSFFYGDLVRSPSRNPQPDERVDPAPGSGGSTN